MVNKRVESCLALSLDASSTLAVSTNANKNRLKIFTGKILIRFVSFHTRRSIRLE